MDPELAFIINNLLIPIAGMGTGIILVVSGLKTVRHFIDRRHPRGDGDANLQLEELRSRLEDLERAGGRVDELEERLEFTERLLTRARESQDVK